MWEGLVLMSDVVCLWSGMQTFRLTKWRPPRSQKRDKYDKNVYESISDGVGVGNKIEAVGEGQSRI